MNKKIVPQTPQETQLSLWNDNPPQDTRPLPERIASGGVDWQAFGLAYHDHDSKRYYAVQDWITGVALTENPRQFWNELKQRSRKNGLELSTSCLQLPYRANNGKTYKLDHADAETLYLITQRMSTETGIRNRILAYLAKAGVTLDEMRNQANAAPQLSSHDKALAKKKMLKQGYTESEVQSYLEIVLPARVSRNELGDIIKATVLNPNYGIATNTEYRGLFGKTAAQISEITGFHNARDGMTEAGRVQLRLAEINIKQLLAQESEMISFERALEIIQLVTNLYRPAIQQMQSLLGVDLATGQVLLSK